MGCVRVCLCARVNDVCMCVCVSLSLSSHLPTAAQVLYFRSRRGEMVSFAGSSPVNRVRPNFHSSCKPLVHFLMDFHLNTRNV